MPEIVTLEVKREANLDPAWCVLLGTRQGNQHSSKTSLYPRFKTRAAAVDLGREILRAYRAEGWVTEFKVNAAKPKSKVSKRK